MASNKTAEIRDYGDNQTIVLYTNDGQLRTDLSNHSKCLNVISYEQEQKGRPVLVGVDLYFPERSRKFLERKLHGLGYATDLDILDIREHTKSKSGR